MRPANQPPLPPLPPTPDAAGHLPLPLLRQYVAGALPTAEQHRIEAHTLSCSRCAEILEGLEQSDVATTDQALSQLHQRLHQRVAQEAAPRGTAQAWRAMAAVLLLLLASTAVWWGLRKPQQPAAEPVLVASRPEAAPAEVAAASTVAPEKPETTDAVASAPVVVAETAAAPAVAARPNRPRVLAQVKRSSRPTRTATRRPATEPAGAVTAAVVTADAPTVAYNAPAPAATQAGKAEETSSALSAAKEAADTVTNPAPAVAKAKQVLTEERVARKAALPPAVIVTPQPVGGYIALREYLRRENKFKPEHPTIELSGTVRVKFTVTAAGKLENFQIVHGMRSDYNQEAIRLLCEGPAWQPGAANGRRSDQVVEISVSF
ncbi:energy transducer TonB [Hymenobacter sp. BT635]|uniref:Energy transducer TonB n=1 Tax=Hymenobacter nitidus TaxID=2880929 RepID=A0ABS8AGI9_9BACT|nr:energy transducer TonB [Hymenobacter nitidus]MCB2378574.1 energy transducer TonB [Hymenobacter nitidus]